MICKNKKALRMYCCEDISLIENYDEAISDNKMWDCHHRLEIQENGKILSKQDLIKLNLYYHRPASELIFLNEDEHNKLHNIGEKNPFFRKTHTLKTRKKIGVATSKQCKFLTPAGEIRIMNRINAGRWHPDWIKIGEG